MDVWVAAVFERSRNMPESTRKLAQQAVEASARREAELQAMRPDEREKAIRDWARKLAEETAGLDD